METGYSHLDDSSIKITLAPECDADHTLLTKLWPSFQKSTATIDVDFGRGYDYAYSRLEITLTSIE